MDGHHRVAVTAIGAVSPYGVGWEALLDGLTEGRSAITPLSIFENPLDVVPVVGQVSSALDVEAPRGWHLSRTDRLAIMAAQQVAKSASMTPAIRRECAVVVATTVGGLSDIAPAVATGPAAYYGRGGVGPVSTYPVSHAGDTVAAALGLGGPRVGLSVACASGAMAIAAAARAIVNGRTTVALAGGSDALCAYTLAGFHALQALDREPCRPFSESRAGLNIGEGAAMLLLEDLAHARARGAPVLAMVSGWGASNDAYHPTAPHPEGRGLAQSIRQAMNMAGVAADEVGYVNAHGTGTRLNDAAEVRTYERAFSGRTSPVPVSSTKAHIGHTLGAAGALEAVIVLLSLRAGRLFPTLRLDKPIETTGADLMSGAIRPTSMDVAMSVSAGFGGSNTSLVFTRDRGGEM